MKKKEWKLYAQYLQSTVDELMQTVDDLRGEQIKSNEQVYFLEGKLSEESADRDKLERRVRYYGIKAAQHTEWYNELLVENAEMKNQLNAISDIVNNAEK